MSKKKVSKKVSKKIGAQTDSPSEKPELVTVKIRVKMDGSLALADAGKQIEIKKHDLDYVESAMRNFHRAQDILGKYYDA